MRLSDVASGRRDRLLPVADELVPLLTQPGLVRGSVLAVQGPGALTLATALVADISHAGGWVAAVSLGRMGISAVAERGASLDRWAFVDEPGDTTAGVINALVGNVDVVLLAGGVRLASAHSRRLRTRLRERGTVMISISEERAGSRGAGSGGSDSRGAGSRGISSGGSSAFSPDVTLTVERAAWTGIGQGHGRLRERRAEVVAVGRGAASLPRRAVLWLPDATGRIRTVSDAANSVNRPVDAARSDTQRIDPTGSTDADVVVPLMSHAG